jgi:hypothetical protein
MSTTLDHVAASDRDGEELASERYRLLVEQLRDEAGGGHGWQQHVADRLGVTQPHPKMIVEREKRAGRAIIARAITRLRLRPEFFFEPSLGEPDYRDFVDDHEVAPDPPFWREFLDKYEHLDDLTAAELERIKGFYGRDHRVRSWLDWERLAEWLRTSKTSPRTPP